MTEIMALLNETDLAQQAGKMRLRRDENTLTVVGSGVILFGVWTVVKMVLQEINRFPEFMAELGADVKKKRFDMGGTSDAPVVTETTVESVAPAESAAVRCAVRGRPRGAMC